MLGRARKPFLLTIGLAAALLAIVLAGAAAVLTTTAGARIALAALAKLLPGALAIEAADGSIASGLVLVDVRYDSPELAATLGRIELDADLGALLDRRVVLSRLAIEDGVVTLREPPSSAPQSTGEPPALPVAPKWLEVTSLQIRDVALAGSADAVVTALDSSIAGQQISIETLDADVGGGRVLASGRARLDAAPTARIEGSWSMTADSRETAQNSAETRIELAADIELATDSRPWRATLAWDLLEMQAAGTRWSSATGRLTLTPGTSPIGAELTAELTSTALPTATAVSGSARLQGDTLEIDELSVATLGGRIVARGVADLGARAGYAAVEYSMLDPGFVDPRIEGSLSGTATAAFVAEPEMVVGAAGALDGTLGGRPLGGALRARFERGVAHVDRARVALEASVIDIAGSVSADAVELTFDAVLPNLAQWYPPAAGSLRARGSLSGPARDPRIDAMLVGEDVAIETLPPLEEIALDVLGTLSAHDARLDATTAYGAFGVHVDQGWNGERLAGTVLESRLALSRAGEWALSTPAEYAVAGAHADLAPLCYSGPVEARICVAVADETLRVDADGMPSALAEPWIADGLRLDGAADLTLALAWRPPMQGSFTLTQPALRVRQQGAADAGEPAPSELASIDDLRVTGALTDQALEMQLTASLAATGDPLEARATLTPPTADGRLDASLSARLSNLELVDALVEDVEQLTGSADVSLQAMGSLGDPALSGELTVRSLGAFVPRLGIELTDGRLSAQPVGRDTVRLSAALCSNGCVELDGSLELRPGMTPWRATAELRGDSFELAGLDDLSAVIAPALTLDATPAAWRVTGALTVEEGLLAVEALPRSAIRPVQETVVHGRNATAESEDLPVPLVLDVDVRLGSVRFEGLGISAELDGLLDIGRTAEGQLIVNGTASIEQGTFSAYSQQLTIERGDLLFTGPSDNPALDVRATREVEGATVGLALTGTLRNPQSEIFSMPTLTESEALARLVTGRSLASAGTADAEAIERAALGLGIRRALPALERIGDNLGLDELGVDSGAGEDSALVAGRQLREDVYLRYKHGLFDDFAGFELIYRITERFRLRTETGTSQSIDLLYERNREEDAPLAETESAFENDATPGAVTPGSLSEPQ